MTRPTWLSAPAPSTASAVAERPEVETGAGREGSVGALPPDPTYGSSTKNYWPGSLTKEAILYVISNMQDALVMEVADGNAASEAMVLLNAFDAAIRDHEKHGANWLNKHGSNLLTQLRLTGLFPWLGTAEQELEGEALAQLTGQIFGVKVPTRKTSNNPCPLPSPGEQLMVYDKTMGRIEFDKAARVVIAGRVRPVAVVDPGVEAAWAWHDHVYESKEAAS